MKKGGSTIVFILGTAIGIIAGGAIAYVLLNKPTTKSEPPLQNISERPATVAKSNPPVTITDTVYIERASPKPVIPTPSKEENPSETASSPVEKETHNRQKPEESVIDFISPDDEIIVRKDERIQSDVITITDPEPAENHNDSLLEAATGIRPQNAPASLVVEHWRSPINYKGYKMSKSKLILFGLPETTEMNLARKGDKLILKHGNQFFQLQLTNDFRPFEFYLDTSTGTILSKP